MASEDMFDEEETLEMDEVLEQITFYCFEEARGKLMEGEPVVPFTVIVEGEKMFVENFPGDDIETCRTGATQNIRSASSFATHYAFCYDGYLETDDGQLDAIVVECASNDMRASYIIAQIYRNDGEFTYDEEPVFIEEGEYFFDVAALEHKGDELKSIGDEETDFLNYIDGSTNK